MEREIKIVIKGEPIAKQSVRSAMLRNRAGNMFVQHYTDPKKKKAADYITLQIKAQLPRNFKMFTQYVHVVQNHMIFSCLKSFSKEKIKRIEAGEIIYKNTRPDIIDNLKKMIFDCMSGVVYKDDGIIISEDNVKKYYGIVPRTEIILRGE
jgi:Holliday junction resolvase RusA-like endonuclease